MGIKLLKIIDSDLTTKKYSAYFLLDNGKEKKVNFGQKGARDFIKINDKTSKFYIKNSAEREKVKNAYLKRHANEDWFKFLTPAALSRWISWNKNTLAGSIAHYKNKFKLN
ncbi:MAG: Uncharacterised protein [Owenweeksia sp. TMED14]|nr:MAG: Uncharacterised protein [Owenweeksia sp. TMED14]